jgi:hypothetical protein
MGINLKLNEAGLREILRSPGMRRASKTAAEAIAQRIRAEGIKVGDRDGGPDEIPLPVEVHEDSEGGAKVVIAHPAGQAVQAKHGSLTKAAAQAGLKLKEG